MKNSKKQNKESENAFSTQELLYSAKVFLQRKLWVDKFKLGNELVLKNKLEKHWKDEGEIKDESSNLTLAVRHDMPAQTISIDQAKYLTPLPEDPTNNDDANKHLLAKAFFPPVASLFTNKDITSKDDIILVSIIFVNRGETIEEDKFFYRSVFNSNRFSSDINQSSQIAIYRFLWRWPVIEMEPLWKDLVLNFSSEFLDQSTKKRIPYIISFTNKTRERINNLPKEIKLFEFHNIKVNGCLEFLYEKAESIRKVVYEQLKEINFNKGGIDNNKIYEILSKMMFDIKEKDNMLINDFFNLLRNPENGLDSFFEYLFTKEEFCEIRTNDWKALNNDDVKKKFIRLANYFLWLFSLFPNAKDELGTIEGLHVSIPPDVEKNPGGMVLFSVRPIQSGTRAMIQLILESLMSPIEEVFVQDSLKKSILKHGTKAAILAIDIRNMSHNIASHVVAYWMQELYKFLQDFSNANDDDIKTVINKSKALFRYIQYRADFLAEVATSIPCSEMTFNLKKDILDPFLKDDDPGNSYNNNKDNTKGGLPLDSNVYVLLRYIAESEGIKINFDFNVPDKIEKIITCEIDESLKEDSEGRSNGKPVWVSIPSGIIGKHAFYSILENFIRNAAKHYTGTEADTSEFIKIKVSKADENFKDDYIKLEITDIRENSCQSEYVKDLKKYLEEGFVDEEGRLTPDGWGIKEMLVSTNFLRKNSPEDLYDIIVTKRKCATPSLLEIICPSNSIGIENQTSDPDCNNCDHNKQLGIRLYLKRPKHLAVEDNIKNDNIHKEFFEIKKITEDEFKGKPNPYNILLVDDSTYSEKHKDKDDPLAPCRVITYDNMLNADMKKCMENYDKNEQNYSLINDNYYLCRYEMFIRDRIRRNSRALLPKIYNNAANCNFANSHLSVDTIFNMDLESIICFYNHPEVGNQIVARKCFDNCCYFQPLSGSFSTKAKLFKNKTFPTNIRTHFYLELIEAALTEVVIVDERISEWASKQSKYFGGKLVREMLRKMKVYIPVIKKDNITYEELINKLSKESLGCNVFCSKEKDNAHFFIIHQGILDKLKNNKDELMNVEIKCRWKVVDSGRGVPKKIEHRFVQITALQTLLENYDKHGLVQTLFSLRKPVKEGQSGNQD